MTTQSARNKTLVPFLCMKTLKSPQDFWQRFLCITLVTALLFTAGVSSVRGGAMVNLVYQSGYPTSGNTTSISNLLLNTSSYPGAPDGANGVTNGLQVLNTNWGSDFGDWSRGYIDAPQTGQYIFYIASDDDGEFLLSTNESPANTVLICSNINHAVSFGQYSGISSQKSTLISLVAGHKYYFDMFHSQGSGGTHCEVAWTLPDGTYEPVISPEHLWPAPVEASPSGAPQPTAPTILSTYFTINDFSSNPQPVSQLPATTILNQGLPANITGLTVEASQPAYVQWYSNSVAIPGANVMSYRFPRVNLSADGAVYSVTISNDQGQVSASTTISVIPDTTPPTLVDGLNLGNPAGDIAVVFSELVDPVTGTNIANYAINNGATIVGAKLNAGGGAVLLQVTGLTVGTAYTVTVNNVTDYAGNPVAANSPIAVDQNLNTWFPMDESSGTVVNDASGNGRNGTLTNGAVPGFAGKILKADHFDGVLGHVKLPDGYDNFTNGLTIAVWANPTSLLLSWQRFVEFGNGDSKDNIIFAKFGTSANVAFEVRSNALSGGQVIANGIFGLNSWQHFVVTMDNTGHVVIYCNGAVAATGTTFVPNIITRTNCYVGRSDFASDGYYQGKMDDIRIYNRVLSPQAVAALATGGGTDDSNASLPIIAVSATTPTTAEKNTAPGVFTVTRTGNTNSAIAVNYAISGTATNGINYTNITGSVTIAAGATNAFVSIGAKDLTFADLQRTVILTLTDTTNYILGDLNSDTVIIQNNDIVPTAFLATADNIYAVGVPTNSIDVWFHAPVTAPSAVNLGNYSLNVGGLNITNAVLSATRNLRVVLQVDGPVPTNAQLTVSGVQDAGGNSGGSTIPIQVRLAPINVIANVYHGGTSSRTVAFTFMNNDLVTLLDSGTFGGFDTFVSTATPTLTQFAGMLYAEKIDLRAIKVDLGNQRTDGGNWKSQPSVYILTNAVDTASTRPESNPNWMLVPANLISGSLFPGTGVDPNPSPNSPLTFDLSSLPANQRLCYGWAVGGVLGCGSSGFLDLAELRGYGFAADTAKFAQQPTNLTITAGQRATFSTLVTNFFYTNLTSLATIGSINYQWLRNGTVITGATNGFYTTPQTTTADNGAQFNVIVTNNLCAITSSVATLTVTTRSTPPVVSVATIDLFSNIDVWFDEPVDPATGTTIGNFTVSDPALTLASISQDAYGCHVLLKFTGLRSSANPTITVSGVQDTFGNTLTSQTKALISQDWPVQNFVANQFHQARSLMLTVATNGVAQTSSTANTANADTAAGPKGVNSYVGLTYSQRQVFGLIKVDLGHQYGDGGDWSAKPTLYLLTNNVDTSSLPLEVNPNWVAMPAATMVSASIFSWEIDGPNNSTPINTPIAFDLTQLPLSHRLGYGWALGGVRGNQLATSGVLLSPATGEFLSISELRAFGALPINAATNVSGVPQIVLDVPAQLTEPGGLTLILSPLFAGTQPMTFQWAHNGIALTNNSRISGAQSSTLTVAETIPTDVGSYQVFATNSAGSGSSSVANLTLTRVTPNNGDGWVWSGGSGAVLNGTLFNNGVLTLTDGGSGEARSAFLNTPQYIGAFKASFIYQETGATPADGTVFVLQNDSRGASALGGSGGSLGYSGITPSAGIQFDIFSVSGIAFRTNGGTGSYSVPGLVNLRSGDPIGINLSYDGTTLSMTMTDAVASTSYSTNWPANLPAMVGGTNTAYVGFTAGDGGSVSTQTISNFLFFSQPVLTVQQTNVNNLVISWPLFVGDFALQQNTNLLTTNWTTVTNVVTIVNNQNQVIISPLTGTQFYRLIQ